MEPVQIERFYLGCLAHASYMIASQGVAAVIDPQRDVDIYLEMAARKKWKIEYIIETHLHADFVSGHHELAERTGARIYLGAGSGAEIPHVAVKDGDEIQFGDCSLRFLQTPGHTLESICILMKDRGQPERPPFGLHRRHAVRRRCGTAGFVADSHATTAGRDLVPKPS